MCVGGGDTYLVRTSFMQGTGKYYNDLTPYAGLWVKVFGGGEVEYAALSQHALLRSTSVLVLYYHAIYCQCV